MLVRRGRTWQSVGGGAKRWCASLFSQARVKLESLGEGDVTLDKDVTSGVATVTLRNAKRKNALSGQEIMVIYFFFYLFFFFFGGGLLIFFFF